MLTERLLDRTPVWLLYAGTALLLFAASEIGFRIAVWHAARKPPGDRAPTNAIMGSTLGLLAFMLGFTFGASSSRFDAKRALVLDEASAILRTHQRVQLLSEPQRSEASRLLREYVALRIRLPTLSSRAEVEEAVKRAEAIQDALWAQAAALTDRPTMVLAGFLQSLAELSDLQLKRVRAAVWNRIPPTIVLMLYTIAVLGLTAMGYGAGLVNTRTLAPTIAVVLAFSAIMLVIQDMERPRPQLFTISQEPLVDVARRISPNPSTAQSRLRAPGSSGRPEEGS